jgi:ketosteroid isomerase-like protein
MLSPFLNTQKIMRMFAIVLLVGMACLTAQAATDLQKLVETEIAFAQKAADTNTRQAFIDFAAEDGVVFNPTAVNAKTFWEKRAVSAAKLEWHPIWADISADGQAGWDTGPWQYKPKGKDDAPVAFGQFSTFWVKQADGSFKFLVDMGIGFEKSGFAETEVKYPADAGKGAKDKALPTRDEGLDPLMALARGMVSKELKPVFAEDCILLIEGKSPFRGRENVITALTSKDHAMAQLSEIDIKGAKIYGNFQYRYGEFKLEENKKAAQRHNFLQIWKYRDKKWQLVLEVINDIPSK